MLIPKGWCHARAQGMASPMGITSVEGRVWRTDGTGPQLPVTLLVDGGATFSALPEGVWRQLGLSQEREIDLSLADGSLITRGVSECRFEIAGVAATSPVVLGHADECALLGVVTLETLGLVFHPLRRQLLPMRLLLARAAAA